jgi:hypothetical protein
VLLLHRFAPSIAFQVSHEIILPLLFSHMFHFLSSTLVIFTLSYFLGRLTESVKGLHEHAHGHVNTGYGDITQPMPDSTPRLNLMFSHIASRENSKPLVGQKMKKPEVYIFAEAIDVPPITRIIFLFNGEGTDILCCTTPPLSPPSFLYPPCCLTPSCICCVLSFLLLLLLLLFFGFHSEYNIMKEAPFDLLGNSDGNAKPLLVADLKKGRHSVTARLEMQDGRRLETLGIFFV